MSERVSVMIEVEYCDVWFYGKRVVKNIISKGNSQFGVVQVSNKNYKVAKHIGGMWQGCAPRPTK